MSLDSQSQLESKEDLVGFVDVDDGLGSVADDEDDDHAGQQSGHGPVSPEQ